MLPGDIVCVASISAFKSPAIKNYRKLIDHTYRGQEPRSDYRWTEYERNVFFQNIRRKDDLGFKSNEDIINYKIQMTWISDYKNQQKKVCWESSGTTLLSRPHELFHNTEERDRIDFLF